MFVIFFPNWPRPSSSSSVAAVQQVVAHTMMAWIPAAPSGVVEVDHDEGGEEEVENKKMTILHQKS